MSDKSVEQDEREDKNKANPFFSIVIPVWNRADYIGRCLESIFNQDFDDYEVIAVDDGSDDKSVAIMRGYTDSRLKIIEHKENRGVCAARHTGTAAAAGKWIVSLDTDWELLPGTLRLLADMASDAPADVGVIGGSVKSDKGDIWPQKPPPKDPFGFVDFLKWRDSDGPTDFLPVRRRQVFDTVQWPTDRRLELQFHFKVAREWKYMVSREVIANVYTDSPNRWTTDTSPKACDRKIQMAPLLAKDSEEILENYGEELEKYTPRMYWNTLVIAALYNFQAGNRVRGTKFALRAFFRKLWAVQILALLVTGLMGPRTMNGFRQIRWMRGLFNKLNRLVSRQ